MKKLLLMAILALALNSCFDLRVEYPKINYYRLSQIDGTFKNMGLGNIDGTLQVRNIGVSEQVNTDHFVGIWDNSDIHIYYYHRWVSDCAELITDFIVSRYNNFRVFNGGTVKSGSIIVPSYILECQLLDMMAYNSNEEDSLNYVYISMRVSLLKRMPLETEQPILLNKVFTLKSPRKDSSVETIAPAYSEVVSQISDQVLLEIQEAIAKDKIKVKDVVNEKKEKTLNESSDEIK